MLQVDRCLPNPLPSSRHRACLYPRHGRHTILERGRSRDVPQSAMARRQSEERRAALYSERETALVHAHSQTRVHGDCNPRPLVATSLSGPCVASPSPCSSSSSDKAPLSSSPGASSSAVKLPSNTTQLSRSISPQPLSEDMDFSSFTSIPHSSSSCVAVLVHESSSVSRRAHISPVPLSRSFDTLTPPTKLTDDDDQECTLPEEMQRAYAQCQITCPTLTANDSHTCQYMNRARILFLRLQGIEVTSDNDPRIAQVRDEDFVFGDEKALELDEECLRSMEEERAKRASHSGLKQAMTCNTFPKMENERDRRRKDDAQSSEVQWQPLEMKSRRHTDVHIRSSHTYEQTLNDVQSQAGLFGCEGPEEVKPARISFEEIARCLQGALFPEDGSSRSRSRSLDKLQDTLFDTVVWHKGERRRGGKVALGASVATLRFEGPRSLGSQSDSTISRTNSWTSSVTDASSASTCVTSPSTSPICNKPALPPLLEDQIFKEQAMGIFKSRKASRSKLTSVKLEETPLVTPKQPQVNRSDTIKSSSVKKEVLAKTAIVSRVRKSVSSLVEFANRVQQSYLRAVVLQQDVGASFASRSVTSESKAISVTKSLLRPVGYRALACDVQRFAPSSQNSSTRELNFASEHNIPLLSPTHSSTPQTATRVFPPLSFVPPSPLRPRNPPPSPEWRLRPIANPYTLRLRALANVLSCEGIVWEGRAHTGSLGCGKERLMGVAFEGLGGSRLAFESSAGSP